MFSTRPIRDERNPHGERHREAVERLERAVEDGTQQTAGTGGGTATRTVNIS